MNGDSKHELPNLINKRRDLKAKSKLKLAKPDRKHQSKDKRILHERKAIAKDVPMSQRVPSSSKIQQFHSSRNNPNRNSNNKAFDRKLDTI